MSGRDVLARSSDADLASLYWWRRDDTSVIAPLTERLAGLAERAATMSRPIIDLPGNHLRAAVQARRAAATRVPTDRDALHQRLVATVRRERRQTAVVVTTAILALAGSAAAAGAALAVHDHVACGFAMCGVIGACLALGHMTRWLRVMRTHGLLKLLV